MYTRPATTVGLASSSGAGLPVITGGCQCHTWVAEAAFDGVNAVAGLTELCCGPCRYCGQSRAASDAGAADTDLATATRADRTKRAEPHKTAKSGHRAPPHGGSQGCSFLPGGYLPASGQHRIVTGLAEHL